MVIGVISDTHGLLRGSAVEALAGSDRIIHAGDVGSAEVLARLADIAPVSAVRGNIDLDSWASVLPSAEVVDAEGVSLYLVHDLARLDLDPAAAGFGAVISGHTHVPRMERRNGVLYLNPGSAGPRRFRLPVTLARLRVACGSLEAELITLPA
jgi:putative phosphoesterase